MAKRQENNYRYRKTSHRHQRDGSDFENDSSGDNPDRKKHRRGKFALKIVLALFCVMLLAAGAGMIYLSTDLLVNLSTVSITKDREQLGISPNATTNSDITNIALFGVDSRDGSYSGLSDTIIVLTVDNIHNKIKMTSVLRDSKVLIDGYGLDKINSAYSSGGAQLAIKTLNQNFNLNIEDYITINFYNLAKVVDAFGGVTITMDDEEAYQTNENLNGLMYEEIHKGYARTIFESDFLPIDSSGYVHGGTFLLNGNQAVAYARNRADSDNKRAQRQQKVLTTMLNSVTSMNSGSYYGLAQQMFPLCETSLFFDDTLKLAPILIKNFTIETINVPSEEDNPDGRDQHDGLGWVYEYDLDAAARRMDLFINEEKSPYWEANQGDASGNHSGGSDYDENDTGDDNGY